MADGWGRLSQEPGVALLTAGPGHCNAVSALYVAMMAESPLLLLSGSSPRAQVGKGAFQEMDQVAIVKPVCKAAWSVEDPMQIGVSIDRAFDIATGGRPGPVFLSLPVDLTEATFPGETDIKFEGKMLPGLTELPDLTENQIEQILRTLSTAKNPLILAGPAMGRSHRWKTVKTFSAITGIPALPLESPRGVDDPWLRRAGNCLFHADVVLLVGKKLDFTLKFGQSPFFNNKCHFVQIDADEEELRKRDRVVLKIRADPFTALQQLCAVAGKIELSRNSWFAEVVAKRESRPSEWFDLAENHPIHPLSICRAVQPYLDEGAILVSDGGEFGQWVQAGLETDYRLINGPSGSIGSSIGLGLSAKLHYPDRSVFVFQGDGTFGYHAMDFDTALRYDLPVIVLVGNDARWNAEHQLQIKNYGEDRTIGCDLQHLRYDQIVEAMGGHGEFVQNYDELTPAIRRAFSSGLPSCVNVIIEGVPAPSIK
tara:strand:+ start:25514 stop:26959 length:1446 start_codon:yes stop_codon:yes gene_type:complete